MEISTRQYISNENFGNVLFQYMKYSIAKYSNFSLFIVHYLIVLLFIYISITYFYFQFAIKHTRVEIAPVSPITKRFLAGSLLGKLGLYCMAGNWVGIVRVDS